MDSIKERLSELEAGLETARAEAADFVNGLVSFDKALIGLQNDRDRDRAEIARLRRRYRIVLGVLAAVTAPIAAVTAVLAGLWIIGKLAEWGVL